MMAIFIGAVLLSGAQSLVTPQAQPNPQIIAQALDRCMATYAVRLTKTSASDETIYAEAAQGCSPLNERLKGAINAQVPAAQAADFIKQMDASAKPNFIAMLAKIRRDRASQPTN
jgi:hypothetical protein